MGRIVPVVTAREHCAWLRLVVPVRQGCDAKRGYSIKKKAFEDAIATALQYILSSRILNLRTSV